MPPVRPCRFGALKISVSIDGFVGGPNGEIDWIFRSMDENATAWTLANIWDAGAHAVAHVYVRRS